MDQDFEYRWCKFCMAKTKQEIVFLPKIPTYKRRRQYKCTICGNKHGYKVEDHQLKVYIDSIFDPNFKF